MEGGKNGGKKQRQRSNCSWITWCTLTLGIDGGHVWLIGWCVLQGMLFQERKHSMYIAQLYERARFCEWKVVLDGCGREKRYECDCTFKKSSGNRWLGFGFWLHHLIAIEPLWTGGLTSLSLCLSALSPQKACHFNYLINNINLPEVVANILRAQYVLMVMMFAPIIYKKKVSWYRTEFSKLVYLKAQIVF